MVDKNLSKHKAPQLEPAQMPINGWLLKQRMMQGGRPAGSAVERWPGHGFRGGGKLQKNLDGTDSFLWIEKKYTPVCL